MRLKWQPRFVNLAESNFTLVIPGDIPLVQAWELEKIFAIRAGSRLGAGASG